MYLSVHTPSQLARLEPRCVADLELRIKEIDAEYDLCHEAWGQGEVCKFSGDKFLDNYNRSTWLINLPKPHIKFLCCFIT